MLGLAPTIGINSGGENTTLVSTMPAALHTNGDSVRTSASPLTTTEPKCELAKAAASILQQQTLVFIFTPSMTALLTARLAHGHRLTSSSCGWWRRTAPVRRCLGTTGSSSSPIAWTHGTLWTCACDMEKTQRDVGRGRCLSVTTLSCGMLTHS
jgi:hypothetical protein